MRIRQFKRLSPRPPTSASNEEQDTDYLQHMGSFNGPTVMSRAVTRHSLSLTRGVVRDGESPKTRGSTSAKAGHQAGCGEFPSRVLPKLPFCHAILSKFASAPHSARAGLRQEASSLFPAAVLVGQLHQEPVVDNFPVIPPPSRSAMSRRSRMS